jgi:hypothetical protein
VGMPERTCQEEKKTKSKPEENNIEETEIEKVT